jgi:hypothetical protein
MSVGEPRAFLLIDRVDGRRNASLARRRSGRRVEREHRANPRYARIDRSRARFDVIDDRLQPLQPFRRVEVAPGRQWGKVDRIQDCGLTAKRLPSTAAPTAILNPARGSAVLPSTNANPFEKERARAVHAWPVDTPPHQPFLHTLRQHVPKARFFGCCANDDVRGLAEHRTLPSSESTNQPRDIRVHVLDESAQCQRIGDSHQRVPVIGHERDCMQLDRVLRQRASYDRPDTRIELLGWHEQEATSDRSRRDLDE